MKNLANLKGVKTLSTLQQKSINGGNPGCPLLDPTLGCYAGPFYCYPGWPHCSPDDDEH